MVANNELDYRTTLKAPRGLVPSKIFGRGLVNVGDTAYEFQTASFVEQSQQVKLINAAATKLSQAYTSRAKKIPMIPDVVELNTLNQIIELNKTPIGYNIKNKQQFFYNFTANKITRIMTQLMNEDKLDFIYAVIKQLSKLSQVVVIDFVEAYERNYENVILYNNNFNNSIISLLNELQNKPNQNKFYIILGIGELKEKIEPNVYNSFNTVLTNISNYPNSYFIFIDTYNSYKKVQVEEWYQKNIDNSSGIWLGKEVGSQILINFSELSMEERRLEFSCMAFVSERGNKTIIKHMVDREVSNNEE